MRKKVIPWLCHVWVKPGSGTRTCFGPRNSKIVYQNSRLSTIPTFNMIKVNRKLHKKSVNRKIIDTSSPTLKTDQNFAYIALFKRRQKPVMNNSRDTSNIVSDTLSTEKYCGCLMKSLKICLRASKR